MLPTSHPTWDDPVQALFTAPYWIDAARRASVASEWQGCMTGYLIQLDDYESVREWAVTIFYHLHSRTMPLTSDPSQFWPDEALAQLRTWINEGCRRTSDDPIDRAERIPPPPSRPAPVRVRKDLLALTQAELDEYRARLDALDIGKADPMAAWQRIAYIHTNWCLHYQEAFLLWHRAFLLYLEQRLGVPIPYWNWTSPNATQDGHPEAGLPQAFKDETYQHPETGEERPNPLRFAAAKDGRSKACSMPDWHLSDDQCRYVQRDPVLYTEGDDHRAEREAKLKQLGLYHQQVVNALLWPTFSTPEGLPGYPWANIPTFPAPDADYTHRTDFDGLYEQPHDNIHGWAGPDMGDNAYTAFDPIFWSHHSNLDRIFENWKRDHDDNRYSATFPIRPFVGPLAKEVNYGDPRAFIYTTIGDMVKDSRALGYDYMPPVGDDLSRTDYEAWPEHFYIVFPDVRCTQDSYAIDLFINQPEPEPATATLDNEHYVGRITRLGMGVEDDKGRCIKHGVTRVIDASHTAHALGLSSDATVTLSQIVTDMTTNRQLPPEDYKKLPGFEPLGRWGPSLLAAEAQAQAASPAGECEGGGCHM